MALDTCSVDGSVWILGNLSGELGAVGGSYFCNRLISTLNTRSPSIRTMQGSIRYQISINHPVQRSYTIKKQICNQIYVGNNTGGPRR